MKKSLNKMLELINDVFDTIYEYGWYLLILGVALIYVYSNYLEPKLKKYLEERAEAKYAAELHKNPDLVQAKALAMEEARRKMQETYNKQNEEYLKRQQMLEEKRHLESLDRLAHVATGEKLGKDNSKNVFKPEYNPLMGAGSSGGYRPPKKGCCGKKCG